MEGDKFKVVSVSKKERKRNPSPAFITSSLQQEAARKLNFRARENNDACTATYMKELS